MKKILIVDDDMTFCKLLSDALKKDFQTYEAFGVEEALQILENTPVDLICSDYNMRDGTGIDLLQSCREKKIVVSFILMSALSNSRVELQAKINGAAFCEKTASDLISAIKRKTNEIIQI